MNGLALCKTEFWDSQISWFTDVSELLSPCFQNTLLIWLPCGLLWMFGPLELYYLSKGKRSYPIPWSSFNILKMVCCCLTLLLSTVELVYLVEYYSEGASWVDISEILSPAIRIITFALVLILLQKHKFSGTRSSHALFIFWFLLNIGGLISYRSHLLRTFNNKYDHENEAEFVIGMVYFPLILIQLILSAFNDVSPFPRADPKEICPIDEAPFLSRLYFSWLNSLLYHGMKHTLELGDVPAIRKCFNSSYCYNIFRKGWKKELSKLGDQKNHPRDIQHTTSKTSILLALFRGFWPNLVAGSILEIIFDITKLIPAILLDLLINLASSREPVWKGYLYAITIALCTVTSSLSIQHMIYIMGTTAIQVKSAIISAVFRKLLKLSPSARRQYTVGELTNMMAMDAERLYWFTMFATPVWGLPLRLILCITLLWQYLGPSCMAGVAVMVVMIPITTFIAGKSREVQTKQMKEKDERLKHMNEMIKVLKLYAWENAFVPQVEKIRLKEIKLLKTFAYLHSAITFVWGCSPFLVAVFSFVTFVLVDENNVLDATTAFVSLTLFNTLKITLSMIPSVVTNVIQAQVSLKRLREFFLCEELDPNCIGRETGSEHAVTLDDATLSWSMEDDPTLNNIDVKIKKGQLVAVVGEVGAGKSSLLSAILGDMYKFNGRINVEGTIAYVPQQAWIQNDTLKENILFMSCMNEDVYDTILDSCCLKPDIEIFPGGDNVEIGEKGINLSGGQKQRVSLARAVYQDQEIYLLDDPLSAVDSHVGKHIFNHVIGPRGMLNLKTRILVTHSVSVLPDVDAIIVMKNGRIQETGTYKELLERDGSFAQFLKEYLKSEEEGAESNEPGDRFSRSISEEKEQLIRQTSEIEAAKTKGTSKLIDEEKMEIGKVKMGIYFSYLKHIGQAIAFPIILSYILFQGFQVASSVWLSEWSMDAVSDSKDNQLRNKRIIVYAVFGFIQAISMLTGSVLLAIGAMRASKVLHSRMLKCVIRTPMSFFDTTPLGRILNRFGKDISVVDTLISHSFDAWIFCSLGIIATLIVISVNSPLFIVSIFPMAAFYYLFQVIYTNTSRQMERLKSVTSSPVYSNFSESIAGVSSIRAYNKQNAFTSISDERVDVNQRCFYHTFVADRWMSVRLDLLASCIVLVASLLAVWGRDYIDAGNIGLNLSYALSVTETLTWFAMLNAQLQTKIVSVERIDEYSTLESEAPWKIKEREPPDNWPTNGQIQYNNYSTRYRKTLDHVLKEINLCIQPQEKVGVVGRTGAGKSSMTLSLFRIIEPSGGTIIIDGVDVTKIGLHDLRSKITIIPQDPVLYSGSVRMNLDPFDCHTDEEIWRAVEHAHIKPYLATLKEGLDHIVTEGGENLSVGQRQLVCLARALLRKSKILILDEATAAIDLETDKLIQNTIREEFSLCTVVTIAHRLHTILDSDRVIVLDNGRIVESGCPSELLNNSKSLFYSMAVDAGII